MCWSKMKCHIVCITIQSYIVQNYLWTYNAVQQFKYLKKTYKFYTKGIIIYNMSSLK